MFQGRFQWVSWVFERSSKKFQGSFKGMSRKFKGCPKKVFRMLQGSFKGISRKIIGYLNEVSRFCSKKSNWCLREFPRCFKDISRKF